MVLFQMAALKMQSISLSRISPQVKLWLGENLDITLLKAPSLLENLEISEPSLAMLEKFGHRLDIFYLKYNSVVHVFFLINVLVV